MTDWRLPSSSSNSDSDGSLSGDPSSSPYTSISDNSISAGDGQDPDVHARFRPKGNVGASRVDQAGADQAGADAEFAPRQSLSGHRLDAVTTLPRRPRSFGHAEEPERGSRVGPKMQAGYDDSPFRRPDRSVADPLRSDLITEQADPREPAATTPPDVRRAEPPISTYSDTFYQQEAPRPRPVNSSSAARVVAAGVAGAGVAASGVSSLASVYQREDAAPRVQSVRRSLDEALEAWWTESAVPSKALLRNGLLVLEAGHSLDEAHRTLLLRTALRHQRGMVTALSHQTDPDRTAYLLKEALLFEKSPLSAQTLWHLQREDADAEEWRLLLEDDLIFNLDSLGTNRQRLATAAIHQLSSDALLSSSELDSAATIVTRPSYSMSWNAGRLLLALLLIPVFIGVNSLRSERADLTGMATVPAGNYMTGPLAVVDDNDGDAENDVVETGTPVKVEAFAIEQTEVTNQSYRLCMQQGICAPPAGVSSTTRSQYFLNPLYDRYPVVNVSWRMAQQYCDWAGKRLPTVIEWEIAASAAPATERRFDYPWGNEFLQQYANSNLADIQDTKEVGTYHPAGTSQAGATDMAGNVAEWTTSVQHIPLHRMGDEQDFTIKGGSFMDAPEMLRGSVGISRMVNDTEPWLGFRCAVTLPKEKEELN